MDNKSTPKTYQELKQLAEEQTDTIQRLSHTIAANHKQFREILYSFPLGLVAVNKENRIEAVNNRVKEITQYEPDELAGKTINLIFPELKEVKINPKPVRTLAKRKNQDLFHVEIFVSQFGSGANSPIFIHLQDITERHRLEQLRKDLVAMVSHDLRTPLTSISGVLSMIEGGVYGELKPRGIKAIGRAQQSADYLIKLVKDLLDSEKLESGTIEIRPADTSVRQIVEKAVNTMQAAITENNVEIVTEYTNDSLKADEDRVVQVLINLISNAVKYSPQDGKVFVNAGLEGTAIKFTVRDQGPGIPKAMQAKIFERYQQAEQSADTQRKGFGLGLAIAKALINGHHGQIWVESEVGKGSSFMFTIPMQD